MRDQLAPTLRTNRPGVLRLALCAGALLLALGPTPLHADEGDQKITLFTAVTEKGDEVKIPAALEPYRESLLRIAKRFRVAAKKKETVKAGSTKKITLPEKLGEARVTFQGKTATLEVFKDGKSITKIKVSKFPAFLAHDKIKVGNDAVVLILDRGHK